DSLHHDCGLLLQAARPALFSDEVNPAKPVILSVGRALPRNYATQEQLIGELRRLWERKHYNVARLEELHRAVCVKGRYLALPIEEYRMLESFGQQNAAWIRVAGQLGEQAVRTALDRAGVAPAAVG